VKTKRKNKEKKTQARKKREAEMAGYLADKGWQRCGPMGDVWKIDHWNLEKYPQGEAKMTLHQAYKSQMRLDASGYKRPVNADDDLADLI
jgi:hypothetical protein